MIVGLSQRILYYNNFSYDALSPAWYTFLSNHTLIAIQNRVDQDFDQLANMIDSFIITGGDDSPVRRIVEIRLATAMLKQNKPVLGICHGAFLLTELLNGKVSRCENHFNTFHSVIIGCEKIKVNSFHSLQIEAPPDTATTLAVDEHGVCEAWIDNNIASIVWHPERMPLPVVPDEIKRLLKL